MRQSLLRWLACFSVTLSACTSVPRAPDSAVELQAAYDERVRGIATWVQWGFRGRLSMNDGEDGGSGRLHWQTEGKSSQLDFRGTLGKGAWRLSLAPGSAELTRSDGSQLTGDSVQALLRSEWGWEVPVEDLVYWVRGLRAPGPVEGIDFDDAGRITRLSQSGWDIEFERYRDVSGRQLPGKIKAVSGQLTIKLVPARWTVPLTGEGHA